MSVLDRIVQSKIIEIVIPDGSVITSLAGLDVRTAREIERGHLGPNRRAASSDGRLDAGRRIQ
ncbi:MAG: hypothetical protein V3S41_00695 [Spirochaetia bacterium]